MASSTDTRSVLYACNIIISVIMTIRENKFCLQEVSFGGTVVCLSLGLTPKTVAQMCEMLWNCSWVWLPVKLNLRCQFHVAVLPLLCLAGCKEWQAGCWLFRCKTQAATHSQLYPLLLCLISAELELLCVTAIIVLFLTNSYNNPASLCITITKLHAHNHNHGCSLVRGCDAPPSFSVGM